MAISHTGHPISCRYCGNCYDEPHILKKKKKKMHVLLYVSFYFFFTSWTLLSYEIKSIYPVDLRDVGVFGIQLNVATHL